MKLDPRNSLPCDCGVKRIALAPHRASSSLSRQWRDCFTLIELLVVVAIIAILAALLAPGLKTARDSARKVACLSQLKQISQAMFMYVNDNNGFLPTIWEGGQQTNLWVYKLWPKYLGNSKDIMICPSGRAGVDAIIQQYPPSWNVWTTWSLMTYGLNYYAFEPGYWQVNFFPGTAYLSLSQFGKPARTIMVGDGITAVIWYSVTTPPFPFAGRHLGGANMTFMDGHAAWFSSADLETQMDLWYDHIFD